MYELEKRSVLCINFTKHLEQVCFVALFHAQMLLFSHRTNIVKLALFLRIVMGVPRSLILFGFYAVFYPLRVLLEILILGILNAAGAPHKRLPESLFLSNESSSSELN